MAQLISTVTGQGYSRGGLRGNGKKKMHNQSADGFMDVLKSGYTAVKGIHDKIKSNKLISRGTDFLLSNPITSTILSARPEIKSAIGTVNKYSKQFGYGKTKKAKKTKKQKK